MDDVDDDDDFDGRERREASETVDTSTPVLQLNETSSSVLPLNQTSGPRLEKIEHRNVSSNSSRNVHKSAQITHRNMTGPEKIEHRNIPKLAQIIRRNMTGSADKIEQRKISETHQNITHRKISEPEKIKHRVVRSETEGIGLDLFENFRKTVYY